MSPLVNLDLVACFHVLPEAVRAWIARDEFVHLVMDTERDLSRLTELQVQMLKHIALDPVFGTCREDFMAEDRTGTETTFVLELHFRSNFLGRTLTLDNDSVEYRKMVAAIDANLASHMFKAALMTIRLGHFSHAKRFAERARERWIDHVREQELQRHAIDPAAVSRSEGALQSEAFPLWRKAIDENVKHRRDRIGKIDDHTRDEVMRGNSDEAMLAFALRYLVPKELQ